MAKRRRLAPRVQKWIRRTHMYLGIALAPWVVLYGVTAVLFNHSDWFTDTTRREVDAGALRAELARLGVDADAVADAALAIAADAADDHDHDGGARAQPVARDVDGGAPGAAPRRIGSAHLLGGYTVEGHRAGSGERVRVSLDGHGRGGSVRLRPASGEDERAPAWARALDRDERGRIGAPDDATVLEVAEAAALASGVELEDARVRRRPRLDVVADDGARWDARISLDGEIDARPGAGGATLRSQLLRLHLQHGDPGHAGARLAWALIVDAMGVSMVLWAISGLVMWWSIKKTRRAGAVALAGGVLGIALLGVLVLRAAGMA